MAALQCEICGGKLVGKPGGIFECDSCGVEYSTEWAKAKVQEIRGTVQIEGPVQVEGTVTVEGGVNLTALLKRGDLALADRDWDKAKEYFDQALNMDAECGHAYFGLTLADLECSSREEFAKLYEVNDCAHDKNLHKAKQFGGETQDYLTKLDAEIEDKIKMSDEDRRQAAIRLAPVRERIKPASGMIAAAHSGIAGVKADGTVVTTFGCNTSAWKDVIAVELDSWEKAFQKTIYHLVGLKADGTVVDDTDRGQEMVSDWSGITAICASGSRVFGLKSDGTVLQTESDSSRDKIMEGWQDVAAINKGKGFMAIKSDGSVLAGDDELKNKISGWKDIVEIALYKTWGCGYAVGLRADGTVVTTGENPCGQSNVSRWRDIVSVATSGFHTVGLKADGTVVAVGDNKDGQCNTYSWRNVVAVAAGEHETVALRADGTVIATNWFVEVWKLFESLESLAQMRAEAAARREAEREAERLRKEDEARQQQLKEEQRLEAERREAERIRIEAERQEEERRRIEEERQKKISKLQSERAGVQMELANLKGLFSGGRRKELEAKLARIENDLKGLN